MPLGDWKRLRDDITSEAASVTDLAASADIEDIMFCDYDKVLAFLDLREDTQLPKNRKKKMRMRQLHRMMAINQPYHKNKRARPLVQALDMGKIVKSAPIPLGTLEATLFG